MSSSADHVDIRHTLEGKPAEVSARLLDEKADHVLAFTADRVPDEEWQAFSKSLTAAARLLADRMIRSQKETFESIISTLTPKIPIRATLLREAQMVARARKAILESGDWLSASDIANLCGYSGTNPSAQPNRWKREGKIFAIQHNGNDYFPAYGLDPHDSYRPLKAMAAVLKTFGDAKDGWGLAYWFSSVNSFLGGKRPQDLLATDLERVIAAAKDELEGVTHG